MMPNTGNILTKEERKTLNIENCRCCLLGAAMKDCKSCSFNFALKFVEAEKIELSKDKNIEILRITIETIENAYLLDEHDLDGLFEQPDYLCVL